MEDVLTLGQPVEVRVDEIDPQGKVSLSLASGAEPAAEAASGDGGNGDDPAAAAASPGKGRPSFEDAFEAELVADLGDLGPGAVEAESGRGGNDRDRDRDRRSSRGRSRRR